MNRRWPKSCAPNEDLTVWTCTLRQGVKFHDGTDFDANDVVASFVAGIDSTSPLHVGNTGAYEYWITPVGQPVGRRSSGVSSSSAA